MTYTVFCTASDYRTDIVIRDLLAGGFSPREISVLMADKSGNSSPPAPVPPAQSNGNDTNGNGTNDHAPSNGKAPKGKAAPGGWTAGIGALAIPGIGPYIAAGPLLTALSDAAISGSFGGLTGTLTGLGIAESEAMKYDAKVKAGVTLIAVGSETASESQRARDIFVLAGAMDITTARAAAGASLDRA